MEELWARFLWAVRQHAPHVEEWLNQRATEEQLRAAEETMDVRLPDDVRAFYRVHNGQKSDAPYFWQGRGILSLEEVVETWMIWKDLLDGGQFDGLSSEPEGAIKTDWWNAHWIPITNNGGGDHHCLDLDPAEGGSVGQIIEVWREWEDRTLIAPSFSAWFEAFVTNCDTGKLVWSEGEQSFVEPLG